jgi:exosortase
MMTGARTSIDAPPRTWSEFFPPAARVQLLIVSVLTFVAYRTAIIHRLVERWSTDGNWSHGFLIPVFSLYFLYSRQDELFQARVRRNYLGAVVVACSLLLYFYSAWVTPMSYPQNVSLVGVIFGLVLLFGGWEVMRIAWFPIAFLLFAIPLPEAVFVELTMPLRVLASQVSASVMPLLMPGLRCEAQSVIIDYVSPAGSTGQLNVEEACSGLRLMMSFVALGVAVAYLHPRPLWQRLVMVVSCLPIAVLCNTIRVTVTGLLHVSGREEYARGTPHQLLGIGMLLIAFGLFTLLGWVLANLFVEGETDGEEKGSAASGVGS